MDMYWNGHPKIIKAEFIIAIYAKHKIFYAPKEDGIAQFVSMMFVKYADPIRDMQIVNLFLYVPITSSV